MQVWIFCNDCSSTNEVPYHVIAHKCMGYNSYNTKLIKRHYQSTYSCHPLQPMTLLTQMGLFSGYVEKRCAHFQSNDLENSKFPWGKR
jgi:hypothetical protein